MNQKILSPLLITFALGFVSVHSATVLDPNLAIREVVGMPAGTFRLANDPRDGTIYSLNLNGDVHRIGVGTVGTSTKILSPADHGVSGVAGFTIGPDGSFYLTGNVDSSNHTVSTVRRGTLPVGGGPMTWQTVATTDPYPLSYTSHKMNGIAVSPDGSTLLVNIGARTDHGEELNEGGLFPGVRETGLTAKVMQLPANGTGITLADNHAQLASAGYIFAEGLRNTFDLAFNAKGELFAPDNGPDRDMADELNLLELGKHYGFPWRMGDADNPQQFPTYDPAQDKLLPPVYQAVKRGTYVNDPSFPTAPGGFTDPIVNRGPDADKYRDPVTGLIRDASDDGIGLSTFTAHRSPLGISFDTGGELGGGYTQDGFLLGYSLGNPTGDSGNGPFFDSSQDLLHLDLLLVGGQYETTVRQIATGFTFPTDTAIVGNKLYVLESRGRRGVWEIRFPSVPDSQGVLGWTLVTTGALGWMRRNSRSSSPGSSTRE